VIADTIRQIFEHINSLSGGNQMIAGAISLWAMGTATYIFREIPHRGWALLVKHLTTEVAFTSQHSSFYNLLKWFAKEGFAKKLRRVKVSEGRWGSDNTTIKSIGYGTHVVWFGWVPLWVTLNKEETMSDGDKETIKLFKIGRSHELFDKLVAEISQKDEKNNQLEVYTGRGGEWDYMCSVPKRGFDSVIIDSDILKALVTAVDNFVAAEEWYIKHGIPYTLGIMFCGPPRTGKSSLIRALASHLDRAIYSVPAATAAFTPSILQKVQAGSLTVIEDVDSCSVAQKRSDKFDRKDSGSAPPLGVHSADVPEMTAERQPSSRNTQMVKDLEEFFVGNISELLNAMDGIVSGHGRILVMTTNYPEKIDNAIMEPGRCDHSFTIGYFSMEMFTAFLSRFFEAAEVIRCLSNRYLSTDDLTGAQLQKCILDKMTCESIVNLHSAPITNDMAGTELVPRVHKHKEAV